MATDFIIDFETFSPRPNATVIDLSVVPFKDDDYMNMPTFEELVKSGFRVKFKIAGQNRHIDEGVVAWWKKQSPEAKANLKASPDDVDICTGVSMAIEFMKANGAHYWDSHLWSRGNSFDISIFDDIIRNCLCEIEGPVQFSRVRDIRTAIEQNLCIRNATACPLPLGMLPGFVHHDSIHDCAKDVLMLLMSKRYAFGIDTPPEKEYSEPVTIPSIKL